VYELQKYVEVRIHSNFLRVLCAAVTLYGWHLLFKKAVKDRALKGEGSITQDAWLSKFLASKDKFQVKTVRLPPAQAGDDPVALFAKTGDAIERQTGNVIQERKTLRCSFHSGRDKAPSHSVVTGEITTYSDGSTQRMDIDPSYDYVNSRRAAGTSPESNQTASPVPHEGNGGGAMPRTSGGRAVSVPVIFSCD
jgi:hypothetical protein